MLQIFVRGHKKSNKLWVVKFSAKVINEIFKDLSEWISSEFVCKLRSLDNLDHWKATELQLFLLSLQIGLIVFQNHLLEDYLLHFNSLIHCAIRILCHDVDCSKNNQCTIIFYIKRLFF